MSNFKQLLENVQKKREELTAQVQGALTEGIQEFMKEHPEVKALGWVQYTPYFNDGDTCEFSVGDFYVSATENQPDSFYDDEPEDLDVGSWHEVYTYKGAEIPDGISPQTWKDLGEFTKLLNGAEDDLQAAFGDHVKVVVTQKGVDVEEYEHD